MLMEEPFARSMRQTREILKEETAARHQRH